jgi:hypothetical protein
LAAARTVFELFSPGEEKFENAQMWKNLLRRAGPVKLWAGDRAGTAVELWAGRRTDRLEKR